MDRRVRLSHRVAKVIAVVVLGLIPWIVYLALELPPRYRARNWAALWVGFDIILIVVLSYAAWAIWFRRQIMVATALVAGTLFACDAWFDVLTSFGSRGQWETLITALGGEIPAAVAFFWIAHRGMRRTVQAFHDLSGAGGPPPRMRDAPVLSATVFRSLPPRRPFEIRAPGQPDAPGLPPSSPADADG